MNAPASLTYSLTLPRGELDPQTRAEMFALLSESFEGVTSAQFEADLEEKNWVILILKANRLVGFSTLLAYQSGTFNIIYSGDTIVSRDSWGSSALPRTWIGAVNQILSEMDGSRSFWLLLTSGFRTYRFLPVFWRSFFPCYNAAVPGDLDSLARQLAQTKFGAQYDAENGIVRFVHPQILRPALVEIPAERMSDPHVDFFLKRNPGYILGDELVCLTELTPGNLTPAGVRMVNGR